MSNENVTAVSMAASNDQGDISRFIGFYLIPPVCLIGFVLNVVSVVVLRRKSFVGTPYSFMVVMAIADAATLLTTSFIPYARCQGACPLKSVWLLYYDIYVYLPISNTVEGVSTLMTVALAIERYMSMVKYFWMRQHCTRDRVSVFIASVVVFSTLLGLPFAFIMWVDENGSKKTTAFFDSTVYVILSFVRPVVMVVAPLVLLVIFNGLLIRVTFVQRSRRNVRLQRTSKVDNNGSKNNVVRIPSADNRNAETDAGCHLINNNNDNNNKDAAVDNNNKSNVGSQQNGSGATGMKMDKRSARDKAEHRLTVMSICIILLFVVGHTPVTFAYAIIWTTFGGTRASQAHIAYTRFTQLLLMISLSTNFFMYLHFNKHFRAALSCKTPAKQQNSGVNRTQNTQA